MVTSRLGGHPTPLRGGRSDAILAWVKRGGGRKVGLDAVADPKYGSWEGGAGMG